jgi:glycosyltransferase involved in cell wall biosynthesis
MENMNDKNNCNVLYITYEYGEVIDGGIGQVINGISSNINNKIEIDIFHLRLNFLQLSWITTFYQIKYNVITKRECKGSYIDSLIRILKEKEYHIVHIMHSDNEIVRCISMIKNYFPDIKIIFSMHSIAKYEILIRNNNPKDLTNEKYIIENSNHIHFLNATSLNYFSKAYNLLIDKISYSIIPNGIDESTFNIKSPGFDRKLIEKIEDPDNIIVLCMSRWSYGKGLEYLLDAIPFVAKKIKNIKFIIAGRKYISWENEVTDYVKMIDKKIKPLKKHVIPLGWLDKTERNTLFSHAHIYIMPSLLEYFPYSILEPMIAKIPIISSKIESVKELIEDYKECLFYSPENPEELAEKILYLSENKRLREQLMKNAYKKVKKYWQWDSISQMYLDMYRTLSLNLELVKGKAE